METVSAYKELEYSAGFASRPGRGRRHNEDDYTIFTTKEIGGFGETTVQTVVIADGSGGGARGKVASRMAVQTVYQLVINNETTPIQQRLIQAVYEANGAIFRQALLEPQLANMRASLIAVAVSAGTLHIARVGDCQAFVIRGGLAYRVTSPTTIPQAVNMAYNSNGDAPALNWEEGNGLLGSSDRVDVRNDMIDINQAHTGHGQVRQMPMVDHIQLLENDTIFICTRSVTDAINETQLGMAVTQFNTQDAINNLVEQVNQAGGKEDVTAILIQRQKSSTVVNVAPARRFTMPSMPKPVLFGAAAAAAALILVTLLWFVIGNWMNGSVAEAKEPPSANTTATVTTATPAVVALAAAVTDTPTTEPTQTPTEEPTETPTETPTEAPTAEPTATETVTETPTETPTEAPLPTNTPLPVPTRRPTVAPTAAPPTAVPQAQNWWAGQGVALIEPGDTQALINSGTFSWTPLNTALPDGYAYELVFWHRGQDAMANGLGWAGVTRNTSVTFNFDKIGIVPGDYNWGVLLVKISPSYERVAQLSAKQLVGLERK